MRRRLNLIVLAVTAMVTVAFLIPLGAVVKVVAADRALAVGDQEARSLASVLASDPLPYDLSSIVSQLNGDGSGRTAAVYYPSGDRVGPRIVFPPSALALARHGRAFSTSSGSSTTVWVPVRVKGGGVVVGVVNVPNQLLEAGVLKAWVALAAVGAFVLGLAFLLSDRLGRSLVKSIQGLDEVTRRLSDGELEARVKPSGPVEIQDMGRAVNVLAERIIELIEFEREQAADLSHRLRTPLTALALEAEALPNEDDRQRIGEAVDELTAAVNWVIVEVRQDRPPRMREVSDITRTVRQRLAFWSVLAEEQGRPWTSDLPDIEIEVAVSVAAMAAAVDALIGNVLAHTPDETAFRVALTATASQAILVVADDGPGFPSGPVHRRGHSGAGSTGLGLDIVRRTAERTGGGMTTRAGAHGGARVEVVFGRTLPKTPPDSNGSAAASTAVGAERA
jgi:signal transduction histidine kinase